MKKLYRSAMFAGVLAIGVAACGDDVTITEAPAPPPPPLQVTMSPSNQAILVGETAVFAVGISGGEAGAQASHTCASSATSVASVSTVAAGCQVTGVAAGNASITVTVTKGSQSASAGGQVAVSAPVVPEPEVVTPATVSIASITKGGAVPTFNNIAGQIEVNLNVRPNDQTVRRVIVFVDGVEAASQTFASTASGDAAAETPESIQLPVNTAAYTFDATAGTGTPSFANGDRVISAAIEVAGSTDQTTATEQFNIRLNNVDGFHVIGTLPANSALDAAGRVWYGGPETSTTITVIPVMFSGNEIASVGVTFCTASTALTEAPFTFTQTCAGVETTAAGIAPTPVATLVGTGTAPSGIINDDHPFPARIDNVAPSGGKIAIAQSATVGNRDNWVRADYAFSSGYTAPTDAGVGIGTGTAHRTFNVRGGSAGTTVIATDVTTAADLDDTDRNTAYNVQAVVKDLLGNTRTIAQTAGDTPNTLATFGVDKLAPTLAFDTVATIGLTRDTVSVQTLSGNFVVAAVDTLAGAAPGRASGFDAGTSLQHNFVRVLGTPGSSALTRTVVVGTGTASATPFATRAAGSFVATPALFTGGTATPTTLAATQPISADTSGYYIYQVRVRDQAGNTSPILSRAIYVNGEADPVITGLVTAAGPYAGGSVVSFTAAAQDAVEVVDGSFDLRYPGVALGAGSVDLRVTVDRAPVQNDGIKFNDVITNPNEVVFSTDYGFIRSLTGVTTAGAAQTTGALVRPNQVTARVYNGYPAATVTHLTANTPENGASDYFSTPILSTQVLAPAATTWSAAAINAWTISAGTPAGTTGTTRTVALTANARGASNSFVNPFSAVAIVRQDLGFVRILGLATPSPATGLPFADDGLTRDWRWTFTATQSTASVVTYHAVGLNAGFDGLVTDGVTVTIQ